MSTHHIDCAAELQLPGSTKLVMLCLADGADKVTRKVSPGLDNVMTWAMVKKSRALAIIADLVQRGLIVRTAAGQPGRMAEFVVFPRGCCALHGPMDVAGVDAAGKPVNGSATLDPRGSSPADPRGSSNGSATLDPSAENGSRNGSAAGWTHSVSPVEELPSPDGEGAGAPAHTREDAPPREDGDPQLSLVPPPADGVTDGHPAKRRQRIPADWWPDEGLIGWSREHWPEIDLDHEVAQFRDYHASKGTLAADVVATWRTWVRKGKRFAAERKGGGGRGGRRPVYRNDQWQDGSAQRSWDDFGKGEGTR